MAVFAKVMDRNAVRWFELNWAPDLAEGDTLATAVWTPPTGIVAEAQTIDQTQTLALVKLSAAAAVAGTEYLIPCHITTAQGEQDDQTLILLITEM